MFRKPGRVNDKNEGGLASIVVVGILIVLLTLISLGFARIMDRTVRNAANDETATAANYAAQSGINDLATYVRSNPNVVAKQCKDLIGTSSSKGPFYYSSNLSGEPDSGSSAVPAGSRHSEYTCLLLNQRPESLYYQQIPAQESKVIKMTTDTTPGSLDRILLSWQSTDRNKTSKPAGALSPASDVLPDVVAWNSNNNIPLLRLTLYPVLTSGVLTNIQADSKTVFLYPHESGVAGTVQSLNYASMVNGAIYHVGCSAGPDAPGFMGLANMDCDLAINGIVDIVNLDYLYLRLLPVYNHIDVEIKARDIDDRNVKFRGVQAVLDVTAKVGPASKRLQARVDIGGNSSSGGSLTPSPNVGPTEDTIPEYAVRSANAICKRTLYNDSYYDYVVIESTSPSCLWSSAILEIPGPQLGGPPADPGCPGCGYFRINGINYYDATPASPFYGTRYVGSSASSTLTWQSVDAISCIASGGWSGDKAPGMTWVQATRTGTGSETVSAVASVTNYDLRCSGPGGATPTRRVTAWPPPTVSFTGSTTSYYAGNSYTIRFSSTNASRCDISSTGNKPWNQSFSGLGPGGSGSSPSAPQTFGTDPSDDSTKTYTVNCWDPSGRSSGPLTWTVCRTGGGCNTSIEPPEPFCNTAITEAVDNGDGTVRFRWEGYCPSTDPGSGYYYLYSSTDPGINGSVGNAGGWFNTATRYGVQFCLGLRIGMNPWGYLKDSGEACETPYHSQVRISDYVVAAWDNGPYQCAWATGFNNLWICRNGTPYNPDPMNSNSLRAFSRGDGGGWGCADPGYRFGVCGGENYWSVRLDSGSTVGISCQQSSSSGNFGGLVPSTPSGFNSSGPWQWVGVGGVYPFNITCYGPTPGPGGGPNVATRCWNGGYCGGSP